MFEKFPNSLPSLMFIIGCGGTGSRLVPLVAQFLKSLPYIMNPKIILADFDVVEEKNLIRQNFIKTDIGKNKALVLAERYSRAYDIDIVPYMDRIQANGEFYPGLVRQRLIPDAGVPHGPIIALCVDSAKARRDVIQAFYEINRSYAPFYIDSGNEDGYGQVILFNSEFMIQGSGLEEALMAIPDFVPVKIRTNTIPCPLEFYMDMQDLDSASCADLDQTLAINSMMASTMMGIIQNHYYSKPINFSRVNVTLEGCSYPEILNVKNFCKLTFSAKYGAPMTAKEKSVVEFAQHSGFRTSRADDYIFSLGMQIERDKRDRLEKEALKKKLETKVEKPTISDMLTIQPPASNSVNLATLLAETAI